LNHVRDWLKVHQLKDYLQQLEGWLNPENLTNLEDQPLLIIEEQVVNDVKVKACQSLSVTDLFRNLISSYEFYECELVITLQIDWRFNPERLEPFQSDDFRCWLGGWGLPLRTRWQLESAMYCYKANNEGLSFFQWLKRETYI